MLLWEHSGAGALCIGDPSLLPHVNDILIGSANSAAGRLMANLVDDWLGLRRLVLENSGSCNGHQRGLTVLVHAPSHRSKVVLIVTLSRVLKKLVCLS